MDFAEDPFCAPLKVAPGAVTPLAPPLATALSGIYLCCHNAYCSEPFYYYLFGATIVKINLQYLLKTFRVREAHKFGLSNTTKLLMKERDKARQEIRNCLSSTEKAIQQLITDVCIRNR